MAATPATLPKIGTLTVTVVEAKNLKDEHTFNSNDPYVEVTLGANKQHIPHKENTNHPKWSEKEGTVKLDVHKDEAILHVAVYDHRLVGSDRELGHAQVKFDSLESFFSSGHTDEWVKLIGAHGVKEGHQGEIRLKLAFHK